MSIELRSALCTVRTHRMDDAPSLAQHGNDRRIWLNLRDRFPHPYLEEHARAYIAFLATQADPTTWVIDVGGEAVGGISLHPRDDIERCGAEMGYWLGESFWGRGIATEAIKLVTAFGLGERGLSRIFAIPFTHNVGSCRALEKAGYQREGVMRKSAIKDGAVYDQYLYAKVVE